MTLSGLSVRFFFKAVTASTASYETWVMLFEWTLQVISVFTCLCGVFKLNSSVYVPTSVQQVLSF